MKYEVIVSDLGTMYQGVDYTEAEHIYEDYALRSSKSYGRMSNKQVMLIDGTMKIIKQHKQRLATGTWDWSAITISPQLNQHETFLINPIASGDHYLLDDFPVTVIIGRKEIKLMAEQNVLISPAIAKSNQLFHQ